MYYCKEKWIYLFFLFTLIYANNSPKIGLVLSGGGSKGFAHIATLKALDSLNIPIDYIAGTSFGAIAGAMYALGYSGKEIEKMALGTDWYEVQNDEPKRKYLPYFRKKDTGKYQLNFGLDGVKPVPRTGLIYGQKIILELNKWTREFEQINDFDNFPIPFRCNAFDIISGEEVIIKEGSLANALRASVSIPTIFSPVEWGDGLLVDGGVVNNLPVNIVKEMGADIVLAVDVSTPALTKGNIKNIDGKVLGVHDGIVNFTIGQRKGIGISSREALYVVNIDAKKNEVIVGNRNALSIKSIFLKDINIFDNLEKYNENLYIKVRSTGRLIKARAEIVESVMKINLKEIETGVSPGQACVFYTKNTFGDKVLGGGWIVKAENKYLST